MGLFQVWFSMRMQLARLDFGWGNLPGLSRLDFSKFIWLNYAKLGLFGFDFAGFVIFVGMRICLVGLG